jgi:hypothetical protein
MQFAEQAFIATDVTLALAGIHLNQVIEHSLPQQNSTQALMTMHPVLYSGRR